MDFIQYAVSYVKDTREMQRYRENFGPQAFLAAKLERRSSLGEADQISEFANELWVCRGDLGAELGLKEMAIALSEFNQKTSEFKIPVIMAGQCVGTYDSKSGPNSLRNLLFNGHVKVWLCGFRSF